MDAEQKIIKIQLKIPSQVRLKPNYEGNHFFFLSPFLNITKEINPCAMRLTCLRGKII